MSKANFVHLHVHSEYSLLDGAVRIKELIKKVSDLGMPAVALTDHGVMYGIIEFYNEAKKAGIKPIIGCEVYLAPVSRFDKQIKKNTENENENFYHLTLLAENITGYKNLMKLVSLGFIEGFYYKPRVDKELLEKYKDGLIALSGCLKGEINTLMAGNGGRKFIASTEEAGSEKSSARKKDASEILDEYIRIFGKNNFFLELQDTGIPQQDKSNLALKELSIKKGIPLVATNDVHYLNKSDHHYHDILLCLQTGSKLNEIKRMKFENEEYYLKTYEEMHEKFGDYPGALENTIVIADRCNVDLKFNLDLIPPFNVPADLTPDLYLEKLCMDNLKIKYKNPEEEVIDRLKKELEVIKKMGFSQYFLIVWDFVKFAKEHGIRVGPGRGSAAGSIVSYLLNITEIEPLKYGLLFERFLNEERKSMPDIDIDFCFEKRSEVIRYVTEKYGPNNVAQLITFGRMAAKQALRDAGRVLDMPYSEADKLAKLIPAELNITIDASLEKATELREKYENEPDVREVIDAAKWLEGIARQDSMHAAGIVICAEELFKYTPIQKEDQDMVTQYEMEHIQSIGLLKMDFLGLKTLSLIDKTLELIEKARDLKIDTDNINFEDKKTFEMLGRGECLGVFQLESSGMRDLIIKLSPSQFEDLIALLALYRPGPLQSGMVNDFIENKNSGKKIKYIHPSLEPVLNSTYGMIVYQEQVMQIASSFSGFSMAQADILRSAISKKKKELLEEQRIKFVEGARSLGNDELVAGKLFDLINHFAQYGFNKSHSAAYAMISYQTAYLKANYPVEFMAACLSIRMGVQEKVSLYINECKRMSIEVLPPDINESLSDFKVVKNLIRFGLSAVKNVGINVIEEIIDQRKKEGKYQDFYDFCIRIDNSVLNKKTIESLTKSGAFDSMGHSRKFLLENFEKITEIAQNVKKARITGQFSLFDEGSDDSAKTNNRQYFSDIKEFRDEFEPLVLLNFEKELLGLYITSHPLSEYEESLEFLTPVASLYEKEDDSIQTIGGIVISTSKKYDKKNQLMCFASFEDKTGSLELIIFSSIYEKYKDIIIEDNVLKIKGRLNKKEVRSEAQTKKSGIKNISLDTERNEFMETSHEDSPDDFALKEQAAQEARKNIAVKIIVNEVMLLDKKNNDSNKIDIGEVQENSYKNEEFLENGDTDSSFNPQESRALPEVRLNIKEEYLNNSFIDNLYEIIKEFKGSTKLVLQVIEISENKKPVIKRSFSLPEEFNVKFNTEFEKQLEVIFKGRVAVL